MKEELIKLLQKGNHCPESIAEIQNAGSFSDLFTAMFDYKKELALKRFPSASFVKKHYPEVKDVANANGFFFNEKALRIKDAWKTILMGCNSCEFNLSECRSAHIVIRGKTHLKLVLHDYSKAYLYVSEGASFEVISKTMLSKVVVVKYE